MSDQIGQLGLDVSEFEEALDTINAGMREAVQFTKKLDSTVKGLGKALDSGGESAKKTKNNLDEAKKSSDAFGISIGGLFRLAGAFVGIDSALTFFNKILDAKEGLKEVDNEIRSIGRSFGSADYKSVGGLESRLKGINDQIEKLGTQKGYIESAAEFLSASRIFGGQGYDKVIEQKEAQMNTLLEERKKALDDIAAKTAQANAVSQLRLERRMEEADILQNEQKYEELIGAAISEKNEELQKQLHISRDITNEAIKRAYAERRQGVVSSIAADQAKIAIDNLLNSQKHAQDLADREADKAAEKVERLAQIRADSSAAVREENYKEAQAMDREETLRLKRNKEITQEIRQQTIEIERARLANQTKARSRAMEDDFIRRIAQNAGNPQAIAELEEQRRQAREDLDLEEFRKTPGQRKAERNAQRRENRDRQRLRNRNEELDRRIDRGVRGEEDSAIERRREERANRTLSDRRQQMAVSSATQGFGADEKADLKAIANAYRSKIGGS